MRTRLKVNPIVVLAVLAMLAAGAIFSGAGGDKSTAVTGMFTDASPLEVGSEVRSSGVKVGEVKSIDLDGNRARVVLDVADEILPLHADARMSIRPINLLGENFIEVEPGSADKPALSGAVPASQTRTVVTLQALLDTFDDPTSAGLAALVGELGNGVAGKGDEMADTIKALAPAMQQIDTLGDVLRSQNKALNSLMEAADPVAKAAAGEDGRRLDRLVGEARTTLAALAAEKDGIDQTLKELPSTLTEARRTLDSLDTVAADITPTLRQARPVTGDLEQISREISEFSKYATPAFNSFDGVFKYADDLLVQAAPAVRRLRQSGPALERTAANVRPIGYQLASRHLGDLMAFVRKWALSTNSRDGISHYFRGVVHITPKALQSMLGVDSLPDLTGGAASPGVRDEEQNGLIPDLPVLGDTLDTVLGSGDGDGLLGGLSGLLGGNRSATTTQRDDADSATGLTSNQEQQLLSQLLGGAK